MDHMVNVQFYKKFPNYFPEWLCHFTFPPTMYKWSNFSTFLHNLVLSLVFTLGTLISVIISRCFNLHFPKANNVKHPFTSLLAIYISSLVIFTSFLFLSLLRILLIEHCPSLKKKFFKHVSIWFSENIYDSYFEGFIC